MQIIVSSFNPRKFVLGLILLWVCVVTLGLGEASLATDKIGAKSVSSQSEKVSSGRAVWYFVDPQNRTKLGPFPRRPTEFNDGIAAIYDGKHYLYIDINGKVVGPAAHDCGEFSEGLAAVCYERMSKGTPKSTGWGYLNKKGKLEINGHFNRAWKFSEGLAAVEIGRDTRNFLDTTCEKYEQPGLIGFINHDGQIVIKPQYQVDQNMLAGFCNFRNGRAVVRVQDKVGYIDKTGKMVISPTYAVASPFSEGLAAVKLPGQNYCYIDLDGNPQTPPNFKLAEEFHCGFAKVMINGEHGFCFIDRSGRVVLRTRQAEQFAEDCAFAELEPNKLFCIDKSMKPKSAKTFSLAYPFSEGMALVESDGKWGFINLDGEFAIPCKYSDAGSFRCGLAPVEVQ
ncbi:MAG TPA: WG repeat-containing protein [Oculatellaceae cyanobacterium]